MQSVFVIAFLASLSSSAQAPPGLEKYALPANIAATDYRHYRVIARTLQDVAPAHGSTGRLQPARDIDGSGYVLALDLYFQPGVLAPAFADLSFRTRRINHAWTTISWPTFELDFFSSKVYGAWLADASEAASRQAASMGRYHKEVEPDFREDDIVLTFNGIEGGRDKMRAIMESVSGGRQLSDLDSTRFFIYFPMSRFEQPQEDFSLRSRLEWIFYDKGNRAQSIMHYKRYEMAATRVPLTPEELTKVSNLLKLRECADSLTSRPGSH